MRSLLALAIVLAGAPVSAMEATAPTRAAEPGAVVEATPRWSATGWPALAGLGLAAVGMGAANARRPRRKAKAPDAPAMPADRLPMLTIGPEPMPRPATPAASLPVADGPEPTVSEACAAYLALHHVDLAIDTLRRHVDDPSRSMPVAWLMLLDLYRTHGREEAFRELAERFHGRFNAATPAWNDYPPRATEPGLEAFPRLIKEITLCWGTHECSRLLDRLLYDNRNGRRMGFSLNAYNDLLALRALSNEVITAIEADLTEEAALRTAFAAASAALARGTGSAGDFARPCAGASAALATELEAQLEGDLRERLDARSALESEQPALAGMLAREWGNSALAERLCEILAQGVDHDHPLSDEAVADLATLRLIAGDLAGSHRTDR